MSGNLRKRLAKLEQQISYQAQRAELANCNCNKFVTIANPNDPDEFEAEMNLQCPAHGFRRLGMITRIAFIDGDGTEELNPRLDELIATYKARLDQADRELANASES